MELSIVLPAYQEAENLKIILPRLNNVVGQLTKSYEIVVVDTVKALDDTAQVCKDNNALYLNRDNGNSFGDAVRTGIKASKGQFVLCMDADGSHPPEFIPNLYKHKDNFDVVIASRYVDGGFTENNKILILMSRLLNVVYALVLNLKCKDVSNSFKIYNGKLLRDLKLSSNNFDIVEEILFKLNKESKKQLKILEVPFVFKKRMFGETKRNLLVFIATYVFTLLKLRLGK